VLEQLEARWLPSITQVAFTTAAQALTAGDHSALITIELEDSSGNPATSGTDITFALSTTSTVGSFLDTSGVGLPGSSIVIPAGSSSAGFEYFDLDGGNPTLTAAGGGLSATQQEAVNTPSTQLTLLASFSGSNFKNSEYGPVLDSNGDLFGTTPNGGANGLGSIFELAHGSNTIITLASFNGGNGAQPQSNLVIDSKGNLFGTTFTSGPNGAGTVFELAQGSANIITLAAFSASGIGANPAGDLVRDSSGDLFGTTTSGLGTVFELASGSNIITTLGFFNGNNGAFPNGGLVLDGSGDLFGTTSQGGASNSGTLFELVKGSSTITPLASFDSSHSSSTFFAGLVLDSSGNLLGTTQDGGANGQGTVFELAKGSSTISTLATFNGNNGAFPQTEPVLNSNGDLFGIANRGGANGQGTVFELASGSNSITTLGDFSGNNGAFPAAGPVLDRSGDLFGITYQGGTNNAGAVFELVPPLSLHLAFTTLPQTLVAGVASTLTLQIKNQYGVSVSPNSPVIANLGSTSSSGVFLSGGVPTNSVTLPTGNSSSVSFQYEDTTAGMPTLTASAAIFPSAGQQETVIPAAADHLGFSVQPSHTTAGVAISPAVQVKVFDKFGNLLTADNSDQVTVNVASGPGGFAAGSMNTVTVSGGIATFSNLVLDRAGAYTLSESAASGLGGPSSSSFVISPASADHLSVSAPARVMTNAPFSVGVTALDRFGNVDTNYSAPATLALKAAPVGGKLAGNLTGQFTAGQASFPGLSLNRLGTFTLISAGNGAVLAGTAQVKATSVTHFGVTVSGVPTTGLIAGQPATFTVSALDGSGAVVANYAGTIHFTSSDPLAAKPADYTFTLADNGSHAFSIPLKTVGRQTITVTSTTRPRITGTSARVVVIAAALDHLLITGYPKTVVSGQAHRVTVQAMDLFNNLVTSYAGAVTLSSSDSAALGLPASFTFTTTDAGRHIFTGVVLATVGSQSLSVHDASGLSGPTYAVTVVPPTPGLIAIAPLSVTAGVPFLITVEGLAGSAVDRQFSDTIRFGTSDPYAGGLLPGDTTFTASDRGIRQFAITFISAGPQTITITDLTRGQVKRVVLTFDVSANGGGFGG
jgi:uncharacterized repeat protein (TIGR03803 family)